MVKEEVYKNSLKYFGSDLSANVWMDKYCLKDKEGNLLESSPDDMHKRLAKEFARIESKYSNPMSEEEIYRLLKDFKYIIPQGSPMAGIGNDNQVTSLSNCYVVGNESDSYGGIVRTDEEIVQIAKRRGGIGLDLSHLRPNTSKVSNSAGTSSGVVSFAERYSNSTREVAQSGRRGALLQSISIKHPDAQEFIDAKMNQDKITGANISVKITNEFMKAVKEDKDYFQTYPIDLNCGTVEDFNLPYGELREYYDDNGNKGYIKRIKAKELWNKIVENAWKSAEPGILFWDTITKESPADSYGDDWETISTNPCVSGDTLILTDKGYYPIKDIVGLQVNVWNGTEFSLVKPSITGTNKEMLIIFLSDGRSLKCTPNHKWYVSDGYGKKQNILEKSACDLKEGDKIEKYELPVVDFGVDVPEKEAYTQGFYSGDGTKNNKGLWLYGDKIDLHKYLDGNLSGKRIKLLSGLEKICLRLREKPKDKSYVPINEYSVKSRLDWLSGIIDSDGTVTNEGSAQIVSVDHDFLLKIQYLLTTLGVNSKICDADSGVLRSLPDGNGGYKDYNCKETKRILISAYKIQDLLSLGLNTHRIDFTKYKPNRDASRFVCVKKITKQSHKEDFVYCFTEPKKHKGVFNGILTGQCGELPLPKYDSCRLLVLNLSSYVKNPFTKEAKFDFDLFRCHTNKAQRLMDDLVDLELEKVDKIISKIESDPEPEEIKQVELNLWKKIREKGEHGRRTGLGITAEGDMLAYLGLTYGTSKATSFAQKVHKTLAIESYKASIEMAKERGCFPVWDSEKEKKNPFLRRILGNLKEYEQMYLEYGRRNIANLTIAPAGSVSLMTQTTSGIEPVFKVFYYRRRKVNDPKLATFTDGSGDMWQEYPVFHKGFVDWFKKNYWDTVDDTFGIETPEQWLSGCSEEILEMYFKESPYYKATSSDVDYIEKVKMQGKIQKWVDHSISVTVNMPEDVTEEVVGEVYETAYKSKCKGITVYREGSRTGVLSSKKKDIDGEIKTGKAPERPDELICDIYHKTVLKKEWTILVGLLKGKPYEIFAFEQLSNIDFDSKINKGKIVKTGKNKYTLIGYYKDKKYEIKNIVDLLNDDEKYQTRDFSRGLRYGEPIEEIVKDIDRSSFITSFRKAVSRVLKNYIDQSANKCPECGGVLIMQDGCESCPNCGFAKCG